MVITYQETGLLHLPGTVQEGAPQMRRWSKVNLTPSLLSGASFGCSTSGAPPRREGVKLTLLHLLICGAPSCTVPLRWSRPVSW